MSAVRIAVAAHKGGVGKSTMAAGIAAALALSGRRVLVVDVDPQGAVGALLGITDPTGPGLYEVLRGQARAGDTVLTTSVDRLWLLPSTPDLAGADLELPAHRGWQQALAAVLDTLPAQLDVIVIDTPPGLGVLPVIGLSAATHVLMITEPEYLSVRALPDGLDTIHRIVTASGGAPRLVGIVPNQFDGRERHQRDALELLRERYTDWLLAPIPDRVAVKDAGIAGTPVALYRPTNAASLAIAVLAQEVYRRATTPAQAQHA
jgi:chromosome partitioning protein